MTKRYTIDEASARLVELLDAASGDGAVEITQRGEAVAVVLSLEEYRRLSGAPKISVHQAMHSLPGSGDWWDCPPALED